MGSLFDPGPGTLASADTFHVGNPGPDAQTGTPALPGLWDDPVRFGSSDCYCPSDCNCHHQGPPFNRSNYCGCRGHSEQS